MKTIQPISITDSMITSCNVTEADASYPDWLVGTAYVVGDTVTYEHKFYECLVDSTGEAPADYADTIPPVWLDLGYNNRWKMFDQKAGSQTENADSITITIDPGLLDSIAFLDVDASEIVITRTDPIDGLVYNNTIDLISTEGIIDGYTYCFFPVVTKKTAVVLDVPPYGSAPVSISINKPGGTAKIGTLAFGLKQITGITEYDPTIGMRDYSKKEVDTYGNYSVLERSYSKKLTVQVNLPNTSVDYVVETLIGYRATPVIWVGVDEGFSAMIIYGFFKSFSVTVKYYNESICNLELEGLS